MDALLNRSHPAGCDEISVQPLSVQRGKEMEKDAEDGHVPKFSEGRANLIALSQLYNLYFVAYQDRIHVYQPQLQGHFHITPLLVLEPPHVAYLTGYLDRGRPHDINRITVGLLGHDEMVIVACDDGDVLGYWTSQIADKISRHHDVDIAAAFTENANMSAWGIAVHSRSRKIAISSNTHRIKIFSFGLVRESSSDKSESEDLDVVGDNHSMFERYGNRAIALPRTESNIPNVAFCNLPHDPEGRLLAYGDILGKCQIWQLDTTPYTSMVTTAHFCRSDATPPTCECFDDHHRYHHAVWGVDWLDPRAFRRTKSTGPVPGDYLKPYLHKIPNSSTTWRIPSKSSSTARRPPSPASDARTAHSEIEPSGVPTDIEMQGTDTGLNWLERFVVNDMTAHSPAEPSRPPLEVDVPFLQMSSGQILVRNVFPSHLDMKPNMLAGKAPLGQRLEGSLAGLINRDYVRYHRLFERLWSHVVIPELSVVLMATVSGRCAIYSLLEGPGEKPEVTSVRYLHLDRIVPFRDQEENGDRPVACLMGIAVAPLDPAKRYHHWRLFLHYEDNTVLCYLLRRDDYISMASKAT